MEAGVASRLTVPGGGESRRESFSATAGDFQSYGAGPSASPPPLYTQTSPGVYAPTGTFTAVEDPAASGYGGTNPTYSGTPTPNTPGHFICPAGDVVNSPILGLARRPQHYSSFRPVPVGKFNAIL